MKKVANKFISTTGKAIAICLFGSFTCSTAMAEECNEQTMDAFAYEDCLAEHNLPIPGKGNAESTDAPKLTVIDPNEIYSPFKREAYLTSSFGESRGTRYHAGIDYSTLMEEGWPVYAPEDGKVVSVSVSPFGYGKLMLFKGESGKTWAFAHQSSFGKIDEMVMAKQYATKKNDVKINPGVSFKKGDTLTFAGSSGIGNPHLHLETRIDKNRIINPVLAGVAVSDTMAPQVFGLAVWQDNELATTSDEALSKGCAVTPVKNEFPLHMAIKIADYSREPKDNPMSIRRLEVWRYDEKIYSKVQDTLSFNNMIKIRDELLWAEEADTAGDWHYIDAKIAPLSTYRVEIEDYAGHITTRKFSLHPKCKGNKDLVQAKFQTSPLYTFLSRPMLDLFRCESGYKFQALDSKGNTLAEDLCKVFEHKPLLLAKVAETFPAISSIQFSAGAEATGTGHGVDETIAIYPYKRYQTSINWKTNIGDIGVTQKITKIPVPSDTAIRVLAVTRTRTDSLDFLEFHPKGMQFFGKWNVCIENPDNAAPLYWLGETSRGWFIFSKQSYQKKTGKRCTDVNEFRDLANIQNDDVPTLGFPYWSDAIAFGINQPVLRIPVMFKYNGIPDGNAITVKAGKTWIAAEYDSEPREIVLLGEKLPEAGGKLSIQIIDEAKHKATYEITIPEM